jgi:S1-C subfamily serine protease
MSTITCLARAGLLTCYILASFTAIPPAGAAEKKATVCSRSIPELYEQASPAVVTITAQTINPYRLQGRVSQSLGSGFIVQDDGLILTNSHVVFGKQSLAVTLDDGTIVPARLVGADPIFDVALIQIPKPAKGTLPVLKLGESASLREGEDVIAIGNPLGLDQTVTRGIVSGLNRLLPDTPFSLQEPLIQTDAPINPGNSGGPLLNHCGEVIGINAEIIPSAQNIGFAIPIDLAKQLMPGLVADGRVIRPWIGFHGQVIGRELQKLLQMPLVEGLLVEVVEPGSPAEKAGIEGGTIELSLGGTSVLLGGDIAVSINGVSMTTGDSLGRVMRALKVGGTIKLKLFRQGKYRDVQYALPERPLLPSDLPSDCEDTSLFDANPRTHRMRMQRPPYLPSASSTSATSRSCRQRVSSGSMPVRTITRSWPGTTVTNWPFLPAVVNVPGGIPGI